MQRNGHGDPDKAWKTAASLEQPSRASGVKKLRRLRETRDFSRWIKDDMNTEGRRARGLAIGTVLVRGVAITVIRILVAHVYALQWLTVPAILLTAGLWPLFGQAAGGLNFL